VDELVDRVVREGVETVIYTDVSRDGMLAGADLAGAARLQRLGARVIASGGIASVEDVRAAAALGLAGAVIGRALYEGRITLPEALAAVRAATPGR
jgi:phosphoribosylformimino-5-aminoimidazole carboxamide ribonucleotide (ProFAR) isomerase